MPQGNPLKGVLLVMVAVFLFALADTLTKQLAMAYPVPLVQAARYAVNLLLLLAFLLPRHRAALWRTNRAGLVLLRAAVLAVASLTMSFALRLMPLGETVAIAFMAPFAVMLLSGPFLGERASLIGWIGAVISFGGVLLIARPGGGLDPVGLIWAVANAGCATAYHLLTRVLARTETTVGLMFHVALVGTVVFCGLALGSLPDTLPPALDLMRMVALGVLATAGHFLFTAAYREAPAAALAPVTYFQLVWAGLLGWLVFGHLPGFWGGLGIAAIVVSGMAVAFSSQRQRSKTLV
jgi:drug/metabolite transporter (DMT)-like permease